MKLANEPSESAERPTPYDDCRVGGCLARNHQPQLTTTLDWVMLIAPIVLMLGIMWYARRR